MTGEIYTAGGMKGTMHSEHYQYDKWNFFNHETEEESHKINNAPYILMKKKKEEVDE